MAYVDLTTRFIYNMQTVFGDFNKLANNDKFLKDNGWEDGTVGIFFQAAAPTGWTKITTVNGRGLRITSGSGGGVAGSTDPGAAISLAHTHSVASDADHTHALLTHTHHLDNDGVASSSLTHKDVGVIGDPGEVFIVETSGGTSLIRKQNSLTMTGSYATGAGGSHDHGAITDSQLSSISLAYANVIFCSKDTSSGYTDLSSTFVHNTRHVFDYLSQLAANDAFNYARRTPAGTISLFGSATSPVGWTKLATVSGSMPRVVSDATGGATGGTKDISTAIALAHVHGNLTSGGGHSHSIPGHVHNLDTESTVTIGTSGTITVSGGILRKIASGGGTSVPFDINSNTATDGSGTSSTDGAHQHAVASALTDITLAYFNSIQASKDTIGAATAYTDYTAFFVDQDLLAYQDLQVLANNDAYLYYHTMPTAAVMYFFQSSAPFNWTKLSTQNDSLIRIVSDTSGGTSGGSSSISAGLTLAHQHSLDTKSHSHTFSHSHTLSLGFNTAVTLDATRRIYGAAGARLYSADNTGAGDPALKDTTDAQTLSTDTNSHNHSGLTGSGLSNITLAYADVIMCSKN